MICFCVADIKGFIEDPSAGGFADSVSGRRRKQQWANQVPERRVRWIRAVFGRRRWRRRQAGHATSARSGHRQNTVRLGERHIDDETERQAAQEKIAMTPPALDSRPPRFLTGNDSKPRACTKVCFTIINISVWFELFCTVRSYCLGISIGKNIFLTRT